MQFEHLIAINDPRNPLVTALSWWVWAGLCHRVGFLPFLPGMVSCTIIERTEHLRRQLNFGAAVVKTRVTQAEILGPLRHPCPANNMPAAA